MSTTKGLEGIVAAETSISSIIDDQLTYVGYSIDELAENICFEEAIYLLWHRHLPNAVELVDLKLALATNATIPTAAVDYFKLAAVQQAHPMGVLRTAISLLGNCDEESEEMSSEANYRKAIRLQAKIPTLVATYARIRKGLDPVHPRKDYGFAQNFLYMLTGEEPDALFVKAFDEALVLQADHELNASTFTARVCVATLSDIYSGVTAAIGALKGPLHGGANEAVIEMLKEIGSVERVEDYIHEKLAKKEKISGFGHRVYRNGDPRAKFLKKLSKELCERVGQPEWYELSVRVEEVFTAAKHLPPNVDFYSASVYHALGIDHDLFTPIFAISRTSGWVAHILEQYENNRLIRPRAEYVGPGLQKFTPISER